MVLQVYGKGHGQPAARTDLAAENVRYGITPFLPALPCQQDGIRQVLPGGCFDHPSDIEDHHDLLSRCVKGLTGCGYHFPLQIGEQEVVLFHPVTPFSAVPAYSDDGQVRFFHRLPKLLGG